MGNLGLIQFTPTLAMNMVTLIVLFLILKKVFFEKVHNFMMAREQKVKDSFDNAERINFEAEQKLDRYNEKLEDIEIERTEILKEAKKKADIQAKEIVDAADDKAHQMIMDAQKEIQREKLSAIQDMKEQIAVLSVYAAEQIIEKKIDSKEQQHIIDEIIEEAGNSQWKS